MADLISRAAAVRIIADMHELCRNDVLRESIQAIKELPAVDAVPVVRCRDCKHRPTDNRSNDDMTGFAIEFPDGRCPCQCEDGWYNWYPDDDWFCTDGERRDTNATN